MFVSMVQEELISDIYIGVEAISSFKDLCNYIEWNCCVSLTHYEVNTVVLQLTSYPRRREILALRSNFDRAKADMKR